MKLGKRFEDAVLYAVRLHADQERKGSGVPYISHLLGTASIALEYGADEDQAIAALLHDAVEDQGGLEQLEKIRNKFGDRTAGIVKGCTDSWQEPKPAWRPRKEAYLKDLAHKETDTLLVSCADKIYNARAILKDYRQVGENLWERFSAGKEDVLWYYRSLAKVYLKYYPGPLAEELQNTVRMLEQIVV